MATVLEGFRLSWACGARILGKLRLRLGRLYLILGLLRRRLGLQEILAGSQHLGPSRVGRVKNGAKPRMKQASQKTNEESP